MAEWWDDFSNNLATDLAPLVSLFGESPTKQYLSECLTIQDIIIFATAPLGVITAVVSAIRVRGTPSLRAFIGRAQDGAGAAEAELCSSTSRDVCELYNNGGIARVFGRPKLLEIVHDPQAPAEAFFPTDETKPTAGIFFFKQYVQTERGKQEWALQTDMLTKGRGSSESNEAGSPPQKSARFAPNPNLALNIGIKKPRGFLFTVCAVLGIVLQGFVLVWACLTRYHFKWVRGGPEDKYAIPLTVIGTVFLCLGMGFCAHLIESKTEERVYERLDEQTRQRANDKSQEQRGELRDQQTTPNKAPRTPSQMYWVQPGNQNLGDQMFDSFGYSDKSLLKQYITSWKTTKDSTDVGGIWFAVIATSLGFICQFLGLRACHSSVSVMQLGFTLIMSLIRALLRAQRLKREDNFMVDDPDFFQGHELDCLALKLVPSSTPPGSNPLLGLSEIESRRLWRIFSAPEVDYISTARNANSGSCSIPSGSLGNTPSVLQNLPLPSTNTPSLVGFQILPLPSVNAADYTGKQLATAASKELCQWLSIQYCGQCNPGCSEEAQVACNKDPKPPVKAFYYRTRLACMTGVEKPQSDDSKNWGSRFVRVRETALVLAQAIEDTMKILFDSESQPPVTLRDSWENASAIFWTAQCSLLDPATGNFSTSNIHVSLRRATDQNGVPEGAWRAERSELEALLGLWTWSLRGPSNEKDGEESEGKMVEQPINRILADLISSESALHQRYELEIWRGKGGAKIQHLVPKESLAEGILNQPGGLQTLVESQNGIWWKDGNYLKTEQNGPPLDANEQRRYFGWHNARRKHDGGKIETLDMPSSSSLLLNCAQEIYSIFLTAVLQAVRNIGGLSTAAQNQGNLTSNNENVNKMRSALVESGLCSADEAFACIVPVLLNQGKLQPSHELISAAGNLAERCRQEKQWSKLKELVEWRLHSSHAEVYSRPLEQSPRQKLESVNSLRLSIVETCETYHQAILQTDGDASKHGHEGILNLLRRYSDREWAQMNRILLVWCDGITESTAPFQTFDNELTLAGTILAYGQAALWDLEARNHSSSQLEVLKKWLKRRGRIVSSASEPERPIAKDFEEATRGGDLSSALYLVSRLPPQELLKKATAFHVAVKRGWYMVVQALIRLGAQINDDDTENYCAEPIAVSYTPLKYASAAGDINTVRMLIKEGASLLSEDLYVRNSLTAYHYAASNGRAIVMEDLMKRWPSEPILNEDHGEEFPSPFNMAIASGTVATIRVMLGPGSPIEPNGYNTKRPALHYAIAANREDMVGELLRHAAVDPNYASGATFRRPPLIYAVGLEREAIFDRLLKDSRVDANFMDAEKRTTLWWASTFGLTSFVQTLLNSGKVRHLDQEDIEGHTARSMAVQRGHLDVLQLLQQAAEAPIDPKWILVAGINGHMDTFKELMPRFARYRSSARVLLQYYDLGALYSEIQNSPLWHQEVEEPCGENMLLVRNKIGSIEKLRDQAKWASSFKV